MSEKMTKLLPKLNSIQHKCKQTKCKQMSEEFENMTKFILYSNQLNTYYLNVLNSSEESIVDNKEVFVKEKQKLLQIIDSEVKTIEDTFRQIICDNKYSDLKQKSSKMECHLCLKRCFNAKQQSIHLIKHLDKIFGKKCVDNNIDENLNETNIETDLISNSSLNLKLLNPNEIKGEPLFANNSDNDTNYSGNMDQINDYSSSSEEEEQIEVKQEISDEEEDEELTKKPQRKRRSTNKRQKTDILMFECEKCEKRFRTKKFLSIHTSRVHNKTKISYYNICDLCQYKSSNNYEFKDHMSNKHSINVEKSKSFDCNWPDCQRVFYYNTSLQRHIRTHSIDLPFKCKWPGCNLNFQRESRLEEHKRVHTGERPFECDWPGCERRFRHRGSYRSHMYTHDKSKVLKWVCHYPECGRSYEFQRLLQQHIFSVHEADNKPYRCSHEGCQSSFVSKQAMNYHITKIHDENRTRHPCPHEGCSRSFYDPKKLELHIEKGNHTGKRLKREKSEKSGKKSQKRVEKEPQSCDWPGCDHVSKHPHLLVIHKRRAHTGERPFECDHIGCDFTAVVKTQLSFHKLRAHTKEKPFKCPSFGCDFGAVRRFELNVHMLKHTGETPFPCEYPNCGKRFKSQRALDTHSIRNHQ